MTREYYFEARTPNGAVMIGHVRASNESEARQMAEQRYPDARSIVVRLVG